MTQMWFRFLNTSVPHDVSSFQSLKSWLARSTYFLLRKSRLVYPCPVCPRVKPEYSCRWSLEISRLGRKKLNESLYLWSEMHAVLRSLYFLLNACLQSTVNKSLGLCRLILTSITRTFFLSQILWRFWFGCWMLMCLNSTYQKFFLSLRGFCKSNTYITENNQPPYFSSKWLCACAA